MNKNFDDFLKTLDTTQLLASLRSDLQKIANDGKIQTNDLCVKLATHNMIFTLDVLKSYHLWLNQSD